ncbi:glycoside hydrolase superfamily [Lasiosphaeris hirsuta]|uniref:chitinase n=1 Tax=Lasiosphaeris hirsuta TaxID=260670 RepID=A0AA40AG25_9PEZI|nr:glycoside hydrolase superfamily [Lasiosphaeris hirsuta]
MLSSTVVALYGFVLSLPGALAGFSSVAQNNIAVYWGQNSANQATSQQRLATYCANTPVNIIPIAFLLSLKNPVLNFASAGDLCTVFPGSQLLRCPEIEADIKTCQAAGKTMLLSLGGATYTEGGFASAAEASAWAETLWAMFGPAQSGSSANRPFGTAVIDGFDFDFEAATRNMGPFALRLRQLMDSAGPAKRYYLGAAPQCPFPDQAMNDILQAVPMDFVSVQFYNNYCGAPSYATGGPTSFNFATWDAWAKASKNPSVKVLLGVPGSPSAAGSGYVGGAQLQSVIAYAKQFSSFGGVMAWDMSQVSVNPGFLNTIASSLGGGSAPPPPSPPPPPPITTLWPPTPTTTLRTSTKTAEPTPTGTLLKQWAQCGGNGYTGPTVCAPPYTCIHQSEWWAHCN